MTSSYAQSNKLKFLDESGETYVKGFVRGQFWARYLDMNQTSINSEEVANKFDISIRRLRMGVSAQHTKIICLFHGGNNINLKMKRLCL
jgi:hypothetical protein